MTQPNEAPIKTIIEAVSTMTPSDALSVLVSALISVIVGVWQKPEEQERVASKISELIVTQLSAARQFKKDELDQSN